MKKDNIVMTDEQLRKLIDGLADQMVKRIYGLQTSEDQAIYYADRVDQSLIEDWLGKLTAAITMNTTNQTFTAGFEPLVSLFSGDEAAWNRYSAQTVDSFLPGLNSILAFISLKFLNILIVLSLIFISSPYHNLIIV